MRRNPILDDCRALLESHGIAYRVFRGGKHPRIEFTPAGHRRCFTVPGTPRDYRSAQNSIHQLRRTLRADGVPV